MYIYHFCIKVYLRKNFLERISQKKGEKKQQIFGTSQISFTTKDANLHIRILR